MTPIFDIAVKVLISAMPIVTATLAYGAWDLARESFGWRDWFLAIFFGAAAVVVAALSVVLAGLAIDVWTMP